MTGARVTITPPEAGDDEVVYKALMDALPDRPEPGTTYVIVYDAWKRKPGEVVERFCENEAWWVDNAGAALHAEPTF